MKVILLIAIGILAVAIIASIVYVYFVDKERRVR